MLRGELYDANNDASLIAERSACKELCQKYNTLPYEAVEERKAILRNIVGKAKGNFVIEPSFWCDYGCNVSLGDNFYANHNLVILDRDAYTYCRKSVALHACCIHLYPYGTDDGIVHFHLRQYPIGGHADFIVDAAPGNLFIGYDICVG